MRHMRWFAVAAVVVAALAVTGTAWGKCGHGVSKTGNPAVREYVEIIPTACGPKARRVGGGTASLPSSVEHQLSRLPAGVGRLLHKVGTSESYGAPPQKAGTKPIHSDAQGRRGLAAGRNPLSASVATVTGGSDGRLIGLLVVMALVVLVVAGMAAYRRRLSR